MKNFQTFDPSLFDRVGLNRHAVFDLDALPADLGASVRAACADPQRYRQLILLGHAGRQLWESVKASDVDAQHPIDDFTVRTVHAWFAQYQAQSAYEILYPGAASIGLQRLGQLAGWHHATPFMVGIDEKWGTWYAYRAVIVADTAFAPTRVISSTHPCARCSDKPCIAHCPASALDGGQFSLDKCIGYRKQADSRCKETCLARMSCPVGSMHRYDDEQIRHTYSLSMRAIEQYY